MAGGWITEFEVESLLASGTVFIIGPVRVYRDKESWPVQFTELNSHGRFRRQRGRISAGSKRMIGRAGAVIRPSDQGKGNRKMLTLWRKQKEHRYELRFNAADPRAAEFAVKVMTELTDHMKIGQDKITVIDNTKVTGLVRLGVLTGNRSDIVIVLENENELYGVDFLSG